MQGKYLSDSDRSVWTYFILLRYIQTILLNVITSACVVTETKILSDFVEETSPYSSGIVAYTCIQHLPA